MNRLTTEQRLALTRIIREHGEAYIPLVDASEVMDQSELGQVCIMQAAMTSLVIDAIEVITDSRFPEMVQLIPETSELRKLLNSAVSA